MLKIELIQGDCLEIMDKLIEQGAKVDLTDNYILTVEGGV
jgi:DNA modification methylase